MEESTQKQPIPWEQRKKIGFFPALWQTIFQVLSKPGKFFSELGTVSTYAEPFCFYFITYTATGILSFLLELLFRRDLSTKQIILYLCLIPLLVSIGIFVASAIIHLFVLMVKGKAGYKGTFTVLAYNAATSIFNLIPFVGMYISAVWGIVVGIIGFKRIHKLTTPRATFAYLFLPAVAFILALMAAIAFPNLLKARVKADEAIAVRTLGTISSSVEQYKASKGSYPLNEYDLRLAKPPYLTQSYDNQTINGYTYSLHLRADGYEIIASPERCGLTGTKVFIKDQGGQISEKDCR